MALNHSPQTITNGLVFYYDSANTAKSWKGKPTTNIVSNPDFETGTVSGWSISNATTGTYAIDTFMRYSGTSSLRIGVSNGGEQYQHIGYNFATDISGQTFTASAQIKTSQMSSGNIVRCSTYWEDSAGSWIWANNTWSTQATGSGDWVRVTATGVAPAGAQRAIILIAPNIKDGLGTYWIDEVQLEQGSFATPFTKTSRSNTQAVLDLTGLNILTATGLNYTSDGAFSFNGGTSNISTPITSKFLSTGLTVSVCMKYTATTANDDVISWGSSAFNATVYAWELRIRGGSGTNVEFAPGVGPGGTGVPARLSYNQGSNPLSGRTAVIDVTYFPNGLASIYENGELKSTTNYFGIGTYTNTNTLYIGKGTDSYFPGSLYSIKLYNRALSDSEIKQNFNAIRGRYGI